jgi:hypothetical protein
MSTAVTSYLKIGERFIPVREFTGTLADEDYIDGAIEARIDDNPLLGLNHWDLVDQLWAYIVHGLEALKRGEEESCYFPDQPLRLEFTPVSAFAAEVTIGENSHVFDLHLLISVLAKGAEDFFTEMLRISPSQSEIWDSYLNRARLLISK